MSEQRKTNAAGVALIKHHEGLRLQAYLDAAGVPTIGYGHTRGVTKAQVLAHYTISREQAGRYLEADLVEAEAAVMRLVNVPLNTNQFAALVSWVYNVGAGAAGGSTLVRRLNASYYSEVPAQLARWCHGGNRVLPGLVRRRADECDLWRTPATGSAPRPGPASPADVSRRVACLALDGDEPGAAA